MARRLEAEATSTARSRPSSARRPPTRLGRDPGRDRRRSICAATRGPKRRRRRKEALAIDENNVEAHRALGLIYAATVDATTGGHQPRRSPRICSDAITHLERAAAGATAPAMRRCSTRSGGSTSATGDAGKGGPVADPRVSQNPNLQARLSLAQAYAAAKDLKGAIGTLEEIVEDVPRVASALAQYQEAGGLRRGGGLVHDGARRAAANRELKVRRIARAFQREGLRARPRLAGEARKQHPDDPRFPRLQARALFDAGDRSGGDRRAEATAKAFPKDTATQYALADLYADAGRGTEAEKMLRQVLAAEPANANALNYLGYLLAVRGDQLDEAMRWCGARSKPSPTTARTSTASAGRTSAAAIWTKPRSISPPRPRLPENSEVQDHLGDVHARRGRLPEAIAAWTRALGGRRAGTSSGRRSRRRSVMREARCKMQDEDAN